MSILISVNVLSEEQSDGILNQSTFFPSGSGTVTLYYLLQVTSVTAIKKNDGVVTTKIRRC